MLILRRGRSVLANDTGFETDMAFEPEMRRGRRPDYPEPWRPPTEVFECGDGLVVRIEIAGLSPKDFDVTVEDQSLRVRGKRTPGHLPGPRLYHESRIRYGLFEAAVRLPFSVIEVEATAEYVDGLLSVRLPRRTAVSVPVRDNPTMHSPDRGDS
jgi:HSP20 family molecular chaperone IbpA